ncbi:MAG: acyl-CoA desaturase [Bacteroidia bacterium]|nr:acyl-CoA desaturase [Bacteroidia bacterium]
MIIPIFFVAHWYLSLFAQTFFLHRYTAHKMFTMSKFWEKTFFILTWIFQGSSFLNPRAYGVMHRLHHAFSDTQEDPHSPHFFKNIFAMMWRTKEFYVGITQNKFTHIPQKYFENLPSWNIIEKIGDSWISRISWGAGYVLFYIYFAESYWWYLLLPIHFLMGPVHGAIVNWAGHKYGYQNYDNRDQSKNTLHFDFLMMGELFQNNHHKFPNRMNFATRWFEIDPTYPIIRLLDFLKVIRLRQGGKLIRETVDVHDERAQD